MTTELIEFEEKATEIFLQKPYWAKRYVNAPEEAKEYYRMIFANSIGGLASGDGEFDDAELDEQKERLYSTMSDESWKYILDNACHAEALGLNMARKKRMKQKESAATDSGEKSSGAEFDRGQPKAN